MLMNNLDEVAERPQDLVVYGGTGRAARNWDCYHAIVRSRRRSKTTRLCSCSPASPSRSFARTTTLPASSSATPTSSATGPTGSNSTNWKEAGLMMYGQMTAGSWIYIGSQGIIQGTYETFSPRWPSSTLAETSPANSSSPAAWAE